MDAEQRKYFLKLYEPVHDRFEKFCRARVYGGLDYQDLMNETLYIAFKKIYTLKSETAFLSFLFSISVRLLANNKRKKRTEEMISDAALNALPSMHSNMDIDADVAFLHHALSMLPEQQKEAIILFEITGFNLKEIAEIQGASLSAVKQRLKRGREKLKEIVTHLTMPIEKETPYGNE